MSKSLSFKYIAYSLILFITPSISDPTGKLFSNIEYGFSCVNLCDIATLLFSLSISVITHSIWSPTLNIFFGDIFFLVQLISLLCKRVLSPASNSQKHP